MSKLNVNAIEPSTGTDITLGASGDTITVPSGATFTQSGTMNASAITAGTVATARLGSGTASSTTILYGDQTYKTEPAAGITAASAWRVDTSFAGDASPIASNWMQADDASYGNLGSAMTESSGIFTFPSTGYWRVMFQGMFTTNSGAGMLDSRIEATINDASYDILTQAICYAATSSQYASASSEAIVDVTDVSNVKVRFIVLNSNDSNQCQCSSSALQTGATFIRLGDT
jgi:hypothetical protein